MAPGSEPDSVIKLANIIEPHVYGMALAGAGGGGFLYAFSKEKNAKNKLQQILDENNLNMQLYDAKVCKDGIEFSFI
jgi:hypothetical protein